MQMIDDKKIALGLRIKELRAEQNITQERFSLMTGVNRSYLASIERGARNMSFATLVRIAEGFGMTLEEFFRGIE